MKPAKRKVFFRFTRLVLLSLLVGGVAGFQQHAVAASPIELQASQWVKTQIELLGQQQTWSLLQVTPNIKLFNLKGRASTCGTPLQFIAPSLTQSPTRFPLTIQCGTANPTWIIRAQADVEIRLTAVVAAELLPPGTVVTAENSKLAPILLTPAMRMNVIVDPNDVLQMTVKRTIAENQPLSTLVLSTPRLISRNQPVTLVIEQQGLALATSGIALQNGGKGATIRVKNSRSGRVLSGTVIDSQQVMIRAIE